jgi:hypothetical protein
MKDKFYKALDKITDEILGMDQKTFEKIIETHKNGEYAQTLKDINFLLKEDIYEFDKTNISVSFETPKIIPSINDEKYVMEQTKVIKIEKRTINIGEYEWLSQAA